MEPRNYESGAVGTAPIAPGVPSNGYPTDGNPGTGTPATRPGAHWYHKVGEELRAIIVAAGLTPGDGNLHQVLDAIQSLFPGTAVLNLLDNPAFSVNQRGYVSGTATVGANQVTLDRWRVPTTGQSVTFAASGAGNAVTAPASGIEQIIRAGNIRGGTYTVGWTGAGTCTVNGTAATNGSQVTLPANTQVSVKFFGAVREVMFVPGSSAGTFVMRSASEELRRCQVEYWVLGHTITLQGNASTGGDRVYANIQFPCQMGAAPTITSSWASPTNVSANTIQTSGVDGLLLVIQATNPGSFAANYSSGNSASTGI